ncbi:MAG: flagellar basal body P-ring formation chaperone FlgA [Gemmatimonas sp.]
MSLRDAALLAFVAMVPVSMVSAQNPSSNAAPHVVASDSTARGATRVRLSIATRALLRGDTLRADDIAVIDTAIVWRWSTSAPDTTRALPGWIARRPIAVGEVLRYPAIGAPPVVRVGTHVSVIYQDGPVRILLTGVATNTAPLGAPVGVRIDPTRRLDGIAVAPNTVRLRRD